VSSATGEVRTRVEVLRGLITLGCKPGEQPPPSNWGVKLTKEMERPLDIRQAAHREAVGSPIPWWVQSVATGQA
jgi:hypothetical protein